MPYTRRLAVEDRTYIILNLDDDSAVASTATKDVAVTPPAGYIYRFVSMVLSCATPGGTSSGTHVFIIYDSTKQIVFLQFGNVHNATVQWQFSHPYGANSQYPSEDLQQMLVLPTVVASATTPVYVTYSNQTDVEQTNTRKIRILVEKIKVA